MCVLSVCVCVRKGVVSECRLVFVGVELECGRKSVFVCVLPIL